MKIGIISIFPEIFEQFFLKGIVNKALKKNIAEILYFNPRDFANNKYKKIDDKAFGGGLGSVMMYEPLKNSINAALKIIKNAKIIYLTPQGIQFKQKNAEFFAKEKNLIFICGRYEGIDERIIEDFVNFEISIGDFILSGGEIPACVIIDAVVRLLPGVLNNEKSKSLESFAENLLDYPVYTRPYSINNKEVPKVLLSGDHKKIEYFRNKKRITQTLRKRPDLVAKLDFFKKEEL